MDFGLKEIGTTVIVGAFTVLGLEFVLHNLLTINLTGYFQNRFGLRKTKTESSNDYSHSMRLVIFIGLSFGVGIIAEDLSYRFVDNELPFGLESKIDSRVNLLIGDFENPKINVLAKDLANNEAFVKAETKSLTPEVIPTKSDGAKTQEWILNPTPNPCGEKKGWIEGFLDYWNNKKDDCYIKNSILNLYYFAKNNVYRESNYYDELKRIQSRSDYARSIAFISTFFILFAIILMIFLIIDKFLLKNLITKSLKQRFGSIFSMRLQPIKIRKPISILFVLSLAILLAWFAYERETKEFNKRTYGYYSSMLVKEKLTKTSQNNQKTKIIIEGEIISNGSE